MPRGTEPAARNPSVRRAARAAATLSSVAAFASTAAAAPPDPLAFRTLTAISDGNAATTDTGYAARETNATAFKNQSTVTAGNYQFISYYGADQKLIVGRRKLTDGPTGTWFLRRTQWTSTDVADSHTVSTIGVDGDGFLHVAWGLHDDAMLYSRSTASVLNDNTFALNGDTVANAGGGPRPTDAGIPLQDQAITYPEFYRVAGSGDLLLTYRTGGSGNGEYQLARWNNTANTWGGVRTAIGSTDSSAVQPWIDNDFGGDATPNANAYINGLAYGSGGRLHATWTWRTGSDSVGTFDDFQSNHNVMYAYSDNHGVDWRLKNGTLLRRDPTGAPTITHDIDEANATPVVSLPMGSSLINQTSSAMDFSDGAGDTDKLYVATWYAPKASAATPDHTRQYMLLQYNDDGTEFQAFQVGNRNQENSGNRVPESQLGAFRMSRPIVLVDDHDRVLVVYSDWQRGQGVTVAYSENAAHDDWKFIDLTTANLGLWEPKYDLTRWQQDGVLSMLYQAYNPATASSTVSILEWDARGYFAAVPEPASASVLGVAALGLLRRRSRAAQ